VLLDCFQVIYNNIQINIIVDFSVIHWYTASLNQLVLSLRIKDLLDYKRYVKNNQNTRPVFKSI